jgi:hypothetical protein
LTAKTDASVHHIRALRDEDLSAAEAAALVAGRDAVSPDVGLDAIEYRDEVVDLSDDGDRDPASDAEAIACAGEIGHRDSLSGQGY